MSEDIGNILNEQSPVNMKYVTLFVICMALIIVFAIWFIYKRTTKIEKSLKDQQKASNEITNLKYGLQDTVNVINELKQNIIPSIQPNEMYVAKPVHKPVPKPQKVEQKQEQPNDEPNDKKIYIESVNSEEVEGIYESDDSDVIEFEETDEED